MTREEFVQIISDAIQYEEDFAIFYKNAAEVVEEEDLKEMFIKLEKDEWEHQRFLQEFLESGAQDFEVDPGFDYGISEEIIDEDPDAELSVDLGFTDGIKLAIKKEQESMEMYEKLANATPDPQVKELFTELSKMEEMHKNQLEEVFVNVGFREVW